MLYDAHIHLDGYPPEERDDMLRKAFAGDVGGAVAVSTGRASCVETRELARKYPGRVLPAYGHHPEQPALEAGELEELCGWIRERRHEPFAIGEVGLPYYLRKEKGAAGEPFDEAPYVRQLDRFAALAAELDRPIVLHAVYEDADKALELLERHRVRKAHFHWFKGSPESQRRMADRGCMISFAPDIVYEDEIRELAVAYPLGLIMAETDGPWPFEGPFAGRRTGPEMTRDVVRALAALKGLDPREMERIVERNTKHFYEWPW
ncbi:TatD family hydrolase [Cohnella zeiphila]|uniref:TatD family hydrolase n=1 Tax=Cohnella zeiphila TaxID=2761120 RepID=A0A7X0VZB1_9BACL|nr:TatD family hydrolase [Cohnella zeiphila]MBB6735831.1 TatD family hydrolase [Cohnella zeiphila]